MAKEFELKYRTDPQTLEAIREKYGDFQPIAMETTYYGTPGAELQQKKWTLRQRMENGRSVCTLKTPAGAHARNEFEVEAPDITAAIGLLCAQGAPRELAELTERGVIPICGAKFRRLARQILLEDAAVELALDRGYLTGGTAAIALCEVEVELKSGDEAAAMAFAGLLARDFGLIPESRSKFVRALQLARL